MRFYFKQVSEQDKTRTAVINEAASSFFNLDSLDSRDKEISINVHYRQTTGNNSKDDITDKSISLFLEKGPDGVPGNQGYYSPVRIVQKQDKRIFINRELFNPGDIWVFEKKGDDNYVFDVVKPNDPTFHHLNSALNRGYLITDEDPRVDDKLKKQMSLNNILFGPPGTGKTDRTIEMALEILGENSQNIDDHLRRRENRETFRSLLNKRIYFVTLHPSYSYEDFVQGIKPLTSDKGELLFEPKSGVFKVVCDLALADYRAQKIMKNPSTRIDFDFVFNHAFKALIEDNEPISIHRGSAEFKIIALNERTLKFETSTGNSGPTYNLSRSTIKRIYERGVNDIILSGNKGYFDSVLEFLQNKAKELVQLYSDFSIENINYVLILDEINRANISKVFGELITLLEEDKRIGSDNELSVTLPSGEAFSVPPNLYIIGTMNTADKSIALVDIALRRRFQFTPMYPDVSVVDKYCKSPDKKEKAVFMENLNNRLRVEKGVDFQIGHAYFLKENSLAEVVNENIIPLLVEYFRNDLEKVKKLLSDLGSPINEGYYNTTGLLKYSAD